MLHKDDKKLTKYHVTSSTFYKKPLIEAVGTSNTATVILSDSLLCHLWQHTEIQVGQQPIFYCLVGGKINEIGKLYSKVQIKPKNIILCAGTNNLLSQSSDKIIEELQKLTKLLYKENVVICSLPYPPKFCELNGMLNEKMVKKISSINTFIRMFNLNNSKVSVNLHNYGSEFINQSLKFKYNEWKESNKFKKLHFTFLVKKQIAKEISKISFPTEKKINLSIGLTSLPLATDFIPKITPVITAVRSIPGLVIVNKMSCIKKITPHGKVDSRLQDKVNIRLHSYI